MPEYAGESHNPSGITPTRRQESAYHVSVKGRLQDLPEVSEDEPNNEPERPQTPWCNEPYIDIN